MCRRWTNSCKTRIIKRHPRRYRKSEDALICERNWIIKYLPQKKVLDPEKFVGGFYQTFREKMILVLKTLF